MHALWQFIAEVLLGACIEGLGASVLRVVTLGRYPRAAERSEFSRGERVLAASAGIAVLAPLVWLLVLATS